MNSFSTPDLPPSRSRQPPPRRAAKHSAAIPQRRRGIALLLAALWAGFAAGGAQAYEDGELLQRRLGAAEVSWHAGAAAAVPVHVRLLGVNDLHGQLETHVRAAGSDGFRRVGGAAVLASYLAAERGQDPGHTLTLIAGDSIGASALLSGLLHDEPTLAVLNALAGPGCPALQRATAAVPEPVVTHCGTITTVGNHEFDHGVAELERQLYGGSHADGAGVSRHWGGSHLTTLASNVLWRDGERPFLPASTIVEVDGVRIGIVGAVTAETPALVPAGSVAALRFDPEAPHINAAVKALRAHGAHTIVLLIHEGLLSPTNPVPAPLAPGEAHGRLAEVLAGLDGGIDVVVAGHTHQPNNVLLPLREGPPALVVQARSYATAYSVIDLDIDRRTGAVTDKSARVMSTWADEGPGLQPDRATTRIVEAAARATAPVRDKRLGVAAAAIRRGAASDPESALGDLVADAERAATGAEISFMNAGGMRNDLEAGVLTHGALYDALPFGNHLVRMTLRGADVLAVLEQQFAAGRAAAPAFLRVSGLRYVFDATRPAGSRVLAADGPDGRALDPARSYTVVANDYIVGGGDHYTAFAAGREPTTLMTDLEALEGYIAHAPQPLEPHVDGRVRAFSSVR